MNSISRLCLVTRYPKNCRLYSVKETPKFENRWMYEEIFPGTSMAEITNAFQRPSQCVYAGFDPTAESLHVGNLLILTNLLHWQRNGHKVVALMGGATGLIGDPSHRKSERAEMDQFLLDKNITSIQKDVETIFQNHEQHLWKGRRKLIPLTVVNNIDWYANVDVISFIRQIGKYFRMGTMLGRSSVQSRLQSETGMSFAEFTYQLFQAYDWLHLARTHNCHFQIGGHDQMGNIVSGYDLITRITDKKVYGLTLPLITAEGGKKFGKSTGNVTWLSPSRSSSFQLYQFFVRTKDSDVEKFLKLFTFIPLSEIDDIVKGHFTAPEKRIAQKVLAENVTILVHGADGLLAAKRASAALYDNSVETLTKLKAEELSQIFEGAAIVDLYGESGLTIYELAMKAKCFQKDHDARRIIEAGGFYVNHQRITNTQEVIVPGIHILSNNITLLRVGKKTYYVVRWL